MSTYNKVEEVLLDVKVILQIIKHGQDDSRNCDGLDGYLTGFSSKSEGDDYVTEVTNSFRNLNSQDIGEDDYHSLVQKYQLNMLKSLRKENQDHIIVGLYKRISNFNFMTRPDDLHQLMAFQKQSDKSCNGTIMLVYDEHRMTNGDFGIRAYRVSEKGMKMYEESLAASSSSRPFSVTNVKAHNLDYKEILDEIPTSIKSSYLMNCLLHQIENDRLNQLEKHTVGTLNSELYHSKFGDALIAPAYTLASTTNLQEQTELMKKSIEEIYNDTGRFISNQKQLMNATSRKYGIIHSKERENEEIIKNGGKANDINEEEIDKIVKMPEEYNRLPGLVYSYQSNIFCESVKNISAGNVGKLFIAESLQDE